MPFGNDSASVPKNVDIQMLNKTLKRVNEIQYLRLTFDTNMRWDRPMSGVS